MLDKFKHEVSKIRQAIRSFNDKILAETKETSYLNELIKVQRLVVKTKLFLNRIPQNPQKVEEEVKKPKVLFQSKVTFMDQEHEGRLNSVTKQTEIRQKLNSDLHFKNNDIDSLSREVSFETKQKSNESIKIFRDKPKVKLSVEQKIAKLQLQLETRRNQHLKAIIKKAELHSQNEKIL
uniref:Uncharacterized protein n=1 Tax=Euplotes harpa TaxID=151035 RepID=A0A7S3NCN4_9SPIT|mmetsp:Transcript_37354/g.42899  ORF Transcript_37354/g.42899 Transcript_37354/m.42899 type:complete len:179 (+) Transcript_37354:794-1330(+)|eukprot:CAMPEP_0168327114 /NCGR_PEP_ID=MMETSP0213-20121227/5711_1 /TAXON_ID=151035 /ORGANISM="Euplotes harpa, Strain FSP1.4" /LENGTH=178 /DNA_ID=CAMNT_0008329969 /DNA_START=701 /DNA_END=1237 /DNA_ORIENTATION=-